MPEEFTFADIIPGKPGEMQFGKDVDEEFTFADISPKKEKPFIDIFPKPTEIKPEKKLTYLGIPHDVIYAWNAAILQTGRTASKVLPPLHKYIESKIEEIPKKEYDILTKKYQKSMLAGQAFGEVGKIAGMVKTGQALGLYQWGAGIGHALTNVGMLPKLAGFIGVGAPTGVILGAEKELENLSDIMVGKKEPDVRTLLWEPAKSTAFGMAVGGAPIAAPGPKAATTIGGTLYGARTVAPYIEKMWKGEDPEWKNLALDMAISVPLGMITSYMAHQAGADAWMKATKNYMVEKNADFIQANANIIKENPEGFMFTTKYKGKPVEWGFQPEVQEIIKGGQADLTNRKTAISLAKKVVDHFFAHPSPQIQTDFSGMSNIIKNNPAMIEAMTKDINAGISPTATFFKESMKAIGNNPDQFVSEAQIAQKFTNQILASQKNINRVPWKDFIPAWTKEIKPEFQQLIESSKTLWESNNLLIKKYEQAKMFVKDERKEEFGNRIEELKKENEKIKFRLKQYGFQPATAQQKGLAHRLVNKSGMTDQEWFDFKQELTGSDSMTTMSKKQANAVIDALTLGPKKAKIPLRSEPVFKKPTLAQWPTSKHTYAKALGLGPMMEDIFVAEVNRTLEMEDITKFANDVTKQLNKQATLGDRLASMVKAKPTKPVEWMANLLDTYSSPEDIPNIDNKNKELFTKIRDLTINLLSKENAVREILGKKPIENVKAYLPHVFDQVTKSILNEVGTISTEIDPLMKIKDLDVSDDIKDWLKPRMPRKPFNPTEFKRQTQDELKKHFSKDLNKLIKWLGHYATREIHMSEPLEIFKGQLEHYADLGLLPEETKDWAEAIVKHDIFKHPTAFEKAANNTFQPGVNLINKVLHPINRHLSNPISAISRTTRKLVIASALAGRPKMPIRNTLQRGLLLNLYPAKHFLKAQFGLHKMSPEIKQQLRNTWTYKISSRFEDAPDIKNKLLKWGMTPYRFSHAGLWPGKIPVSNVDVAMATGWLAGEELRTSPKYIKWAEQKAVKEGKPKDFYKRTPQDSIEEAMRAAEVTQFIYHTAFMPQYFRGQIGRFFGSLTSWGNFFNFTHNRELLHVLMKGESYNGKPYPPYYRARSILGYTTFLGILEGLRKTTGLDYTKFYLGVPGAVLNPMARFSLGAMMYTTSKSLYDRNYGKYLMTSSLKMFTGFGLGGEEWRKWMTGEISTKEFFTFTDKRRKGLGGMF